MFTNWDLKVFLFVHLFSKEKLLFECPIVNRQTVWKEGEISAKFLYILFLLLFFNYHWEIQQFKIGLSITKMN